MGLLLDQSIHPHQSRGAIPFLIGLGTRIRTLVDGIKTRSPAARRSPKSAGYVSGAGLITARDAWLLVARADLGLLDALPAFRRVGHA